MRKPFTVLTAGVLAGTALLGVASSASAAGVQSPGSFCATSGIVGAFDDPNAFFATQGGCASSLAQGPIVQTPFGAMPSVISRAGYVTKCQQIVSTLGLTYPFSTPDGEFTNIANLNQCANRLQQLHDQFAGG